MRSEHLYKHLPAWAGLPALIVVFAAGAFAATAHAPLPVVKVHPTVRTEPVQRLQPPPAPRTALQALHRRDFIAVTAPGGVGHVLAGSDDRLHYGAYDQVHLRFTKPVQVGQKFDVFRPDGPIRAASGKRSLGLLIRHLGRIEILSLHGNLGRGRILRSFQEIGPGDVLLPARDIPARIEPRHPQRPLHGRVLYIRDDAAEAAQNQVIGIDLGRKQGLKSGCMLAVYRAGRVVRDIDGKMVRLPPGRIGRIMVLTPQQDVSIALIVESTAAIHLGDLVRNPDGS